MFDFNFKKQNLPKKDLRPLGSKSRRKQTEPNSVQRGLLNISKIATNPKLAHPSVLYIHCPEKYSESHHKNRACIMVGADATVQYMLGFLARYVETKAEHSL